jgi:tetratricopeptide (TPR) repeat protein
MAHWLAATVFVAREAFDAALEHLNAGCNSQDAQHSNGDRFTAVGLHLLRGLVLAARGDVDAARIAFARELEFENSGHIFARECAAQSWYAIGALHLRSHELDDAAAAFKKALQLNPAHSLAAVASGKSELQSEKSEGLRQVRLKPDTTFTDPVRLKPDTTLTEPVVCAAVLSLQGRHSEAARVCEESLLQQDGEPSAGWILPVEPVLNVHAHRDAWSHTLAALRQRSF